MKIFLRLLPLIVLVLLGAQPAHAAVLSAVSNRETFAIGDSFNVDIVIDSENAGINAAQATLKYNPDVLRATAVDKTNSVLNFWLSEPAINQNAGTVSFVGASTAGVNGKTLRVLRVNFKIKGSGGSDITLLDAAVTASDGSGTNVLSSIKNISISGVPSSTTTAIGPKQISRTPTPTVNLPQKPVITVGLYSDEHEWYSSVGKFLVQWTLPGDVTDVSTALDKGSNTEPTISEGLFENKQFEGLDDGIWYLHVRFKNKSGWGPTTHYRISIDTVPPLPFTAKVKEGSATEISRPTLEFSTSDQPSGVEMYRILVDGRDVGSSATTSFTLPSLSFGSHSIVVQAVDYAGNVTESRTSVVIIQPPFLTVGGIKITQPIFFGSIIGFILLGIAVGWWLSRLARMKRKNRIFMAERDVSVTFGIIQKNIEKMLGYFDKPVGEQQVSELKFFLGRTNDAIDKMKGYVVQNVEEIEK